MPRPITVLIGTLIFSTMSTVLLCLVSYDQSRIVNENIQTLPVEFYMNRVKLFAVPVDVASSVQFDKVDRLQWYEIRKEMLKRREEIEALEIRPTHLDLIGIGLFSTCFIGILIYSPALWVAELRFGNEIEKLLFHGSICLMMFSATVIRIYAYFGVIKRNYVPITEITRKVVERIGRIKYPKAIHFCYYAYSTKNVYMDEKGEDWHFFSSKTHLHMDRVAAAAEYCHADLADIFALFFCVLSCVVHFCLFMKTTRWNRSQLEYLGQMEAAENIDPLTDSSDDELELGGGNQKVKQLVKGSRLFDDRNPKNPFSMGQGIEKANEKKVALIETILDPGQLNELRDVYLSNYYMLHAPKRSKSRRN